MIQKKRKLSKNEGGFFMDKLKIMIVDDNYLTAEGIEKNIDW